MNIKSSGVINLKKTDIKAAAQVLSRAFYTDPITLYAFPDLKERNLRLPYMNEYTLCYDLRYGKVFTTSERLEGIAVWTRPGKWKLSLFEHLLCADFIPLMKMGIKTVKKMQPFLKYIEYKHKKLAPFPHWYLELLGVDPQYQKQGYAGKLLRSTLADIDTQGLPCYLETETEKNVEMYKHFGFKVIDEFIVPQTDIRLWIMLRDNK